MSTNHSWQTFLVLHSELQKLLKISWCSFVYHVNSGPFSEHFTTQIKVSLATCNPVFHKMDQPFYVNGKKYYKIQNFLINRLILSLSLCISLYRIWQFYSPKTESAAKKEQLLHWEVPTCKILVLYPNKESAMFCTV